MAQDYDARAYLVDITEQLAELARREGLTQGAAYLALACMALRKAPDAPSMVEEAPVEERRQASL
ncbi:MAG: hypothetical protein JNM59_12735 [Hyphomonadaceae bacterium]|nr:hypothetical protein [Hyphomonadaceae bacterium]